MLTSKYKQLQAENEQLNLDVKAYRRINGEQIKELGRVDETLNYEGKVLALRQELEETSFSNRKLQEALAETKRHHKEAG